MKITVIPILVLLLLPIMVFAADSHRKIPDVDLQGETTSISLKQFKGKVVLLDFWASWCAPCRTAFPWMNKMQQKYRASGLEIVAVNLDEERTQAEAFLSQVPANFIIAYDPKGELATQLGLKGMPASYLIGREGEILKSHIGFLESEKDEMESEIREILKR